MYVYNFLSHKLLHKMWSQSSWIFFFRLRWVPDGKFSYFFISGPCLFYMSMDVFFTSMWTLVCMCQGSNH
jgi:hypothetical protein